VEHKTSYTCHQLKEVHSKRLQTLRQFHAAHLFTEAAEKAEEAVGEGGASPASSPVKEPKPPGTVNYPSIAEQKANLNSILNDPEASDVISLSCFSRP